MEEGDPFPLLSSPLSPKEATPLTRTLTPCSLLGFTCITQEQLSNILTARPGNALLGLTVDPLEELGVVWGGTQKQKFRAVTHHSVVGF